MLVDADDGPSAATLTHLGNPLTELDDFKHRVEVDDDDEQLDDEVVRNFHFGGGDGDKAGSGKSKQEVMAEIIAKSKTFKAAKRMQKDDDDQMLEDLDAQYGRLVQVCCSTENSGLPPSKGTSHHRNSAGERV